VIVTTVFQALIIKAFRSEPVELEGLRACSTVPTEGAYSKAVGSSRRLVGSTEGFLTTAEVSNLLREAEAPL
jgi:hypothetical protein